MKNNKGFTVVELIVTFAFVMIITIGLFSIINTYRNKVNEESVNKEMQAYKNEIIKTIYDDINLFGIKRIEVLTETADLEEYEKGLNIIYFDNGIDLNSKKLLIKNKNVNGGNTYNAEIKYGKMVFTAPNSFIEFPNDVLLLVSDNVTTDQKIANGTLYTSNKLMLNINIPMINKELNKKYNINLISYVYTGTKTKFSNEDNSFGLTGGDTEKWVEAICYVMEGTKATKYHYELAYCDNNNITIPATVGGNSLETIGSSAFNYDDYHAYDITSIDFSAATNLETIEQGAFKNNYSKQSPQHCYIYNDSVNKKFKAKTKLIGLGSLEKIKTIGNDAFYCMRVDTIDIPKSVTSIGESAFAGWATDKITFQPDTSSFIEIGSNAFESYYSSYYIRNNINLNTRSFTLNAHSFSGLQVKGDVTLTLPDNITSIPTGCFQGMINLKNVIFNDNIETIGNYAFYQSLNNTINNTTVTLPKELTSIGDYAFSDNLSIKTLMLNENIKKIGDYAFLSNNISKKLTIPSSLIEIGTGAFSDNSIPEIEFDARTVGITAGKRIFNNNKVKENKVIYNLENDNPITSDGYIYDYSTAVPNTAKIISYAGDKKDIDNIPSQVNTISKYAFTSCNLTSVSIPQNIERIEKSAFTNNKINSINFEKRTQAIELKGDLFSNNEIEEGKGTGIVYDFGINKKTFYDFIYPIKINNGVAEVDTTKIISYAKKIQNNSATIIKIPSGVTEIIDNAFFSIYPITNIVFEIPDTISSLDNNDLLNNYATKYKSIILKNRISLPNTFVDGWNQKNTNCSVENLDYVCN